jgi:PAS domain S-box-containing protein
MEPALVFAEVTGVIRIWNSGAEALFGHPAEDVVRRTLDLIVPPEYGERHWAGFRAAMAAGDGKVDRAAANVPAMHRDGTIIPGSGQTARNPRRPRSGHRRLGRIRPR